MRTFSWRLNERIIVCSVPRNDGAEGSFGRMKMESVPSRALGGTYPRRGARPGRRLHPLARPRAHQTVARLDESGTIPSEPGNGCVIISKKTSAAPLPFAISHGTLIPMGFSSTLDDALSQSVEHAINMITAMFEMPRQQVYLLLAAAIDFDVTQAVDITKGVHGLIDLSMFQQLPDYERTIRDIGNSRWTAMRRMPYWPSRLRQVTDWSSQRTL